MTCASRLVLCGIVIAAVPLFAQSSQAIRPIPPPGVEVPERVRPVLEEGLACLEETIAKLVDNKLLPDVLFRDFDYLNNARQIPKLPDYAIVDTTTPPGPRYAGKIITAGFFNENWGLE